MSFLVRNVPDGRSSEMKWTSLMADFCFQCAVDMWFGPPGDFAGMSTVEDTEQGLYSVVLCEGCGPCQVDHEGWCVSADCAWHHGSPDMAPWRREVYESAYRHWRARLGSLGPVLRLRDRFLGTPWEPGLIHFPGTFPWRVRQLYLAIKEGREAQLLADDDLFEFDDVP